MPTDLVLHLPPAAPPPDPEDGEALRRLVAAELRRPAGSLGTVRARRISFDGRRRGRGWQLAVRVWEPGEVPPPLPATTPPTHAAPAPDAPHVVVVGSGPAGLFAALDLLAAGVRVSVLERGRDVRGRRRSIRRLLRGEPAEPDSNYCFGEGGAGTYSDGKLYTRSGSRELVRSVLESLVAHGAPARILVDWRPHVGSDRLPRVVEALRETLLRSGGSVRFRARVEELVTLDDPAGRRVAGVRWRDLGAPAGAPLREERCDAVVLAAGHSALDALEMARAAGARLVPKGFAMGVRIEHAQAWLDERQYGGLRAACELPAAFYELATEAEGRGVYSFCMCPGGFIVPTTTADSRVVVNGMSLSRRDSPFANSGLVVSVEPEDWCGARGERQGWPALLAAAARAGAPAQPRDPARLPDEPGRDPLFGIRLQLALETLAARAGGGRHRAPAQRADRFLEGTRRELPEGPTAPSSYRPGLAPADLRTLFPGGLAARLRAGLEVFERRLPGFAGPGGQLVGVETRTSSPVRIERDPQSLEAVGVRGLWPAGEGAGFAGGIVSAALDGRRVAAALAGALERTGG